MAESNIEWCDTVWNCVRGCSRVSEGCRHCDAEAMAGRIVRMGKGKPTPYDGLVRVRSMSPVADFGVTPPTREVWGWTGKVELDAKKLAEPLRWRKPRTVFVNSMSDLFHEALTNEQIAAVFGVKAATPHVTYQVLTKRAKRMREWFAWVVDKAQRERVSVGEYCFHLARWHGASPGKNEADLDARSALAAWPLLNVWLGVSVENQEAADERIPDLLATPAAVRFISAEPLLGKIKLDKPRCDREHCGPDEWGVADDDATPWCNEHDQELSFGHWLRVDDGIDWVIAGCESGPGARECKVEWLRSLRDQCAAAEVPFFLKQAREVSDSEMTRAVLAGPAPQNLSAAMRAAKTAITAGSGSHRKPGGIIGLPYLDGVQHTAMPGGAR